MRLAPVVAPRPHHRVLRASLDDTLALFNLDTRRLHLLNGSAAAIWSQLEDSSTIAELTIALGDRYDVDPWSIRADVERTIGELRADGLVRVDDRDHDVASASVAPTIPPATVDAPAHGSYAALDARVGIVCADAEIVSTVERVLSPLRDAAPPSVAVTLASDGTGAWTVQVGSKPPVKVGSRLAAVLRAVGEINDIAVASVPGDLVLHAGAVADGDRAVVLPAASNHGKSTLTTALVVDGLDYLTDEAAAIGVGLRVRSYAKSIALDPGSFTLFEQLEPPAAPGQLAHLVGGREWHIDPVRVGSVGTSATVAAVVCPHWRAGAATRLHRLEPTEALHLLLAESFDFSVGAQPVFARLVELVASVPVYRLGYGELASAVAAVRSVMTDAPPA